VNAVAEAWRDSAAVASQESAILVPGESSPARAFRLARDHRIPVIRWAHLELERASALLGLAKQEGTAPVVMAADMAQIQLHQDTAVVLMELHRAYPDLQRQTPGARR
jgi:hypothetical protein